jgi:hypothetical protein
MSNVTFEFADFCERSGCDTAELDRVLSAIRQDAWIAGGAVRRLSLIHISEPTRPCH